MDKLHNTSDIANRNIRGNERGATASVTELEGVILGIIWSRQPCSPYVVLSRFKQSPTWGWSSSTGAIYPAIRRLKQRQLLAARAEAKGKRRSELLSLTPSGQAELQKWISEVAEEMGSAGMDPIRTRVNYLAVLDPPARIAFLDRAEEVTRSRLARAHASSADPEARESWTLAATSIGVVHQLEARLLWLHDLRQLVADRRGA